MNVVGSFYKILFKPNYVTIIFFCHTIQSVANVQCCFNDSYDFCVFYFSDTVTQGSLDSLIIFSNKKGKLLVSSTSKSYLNIQSLEIVSVNRY